MKLYGQCKTSNAYITRMNVFSDALRRMPLMWDEWMHVLGGPPPGG